MIVMMSSMAVMLRKLISGSAAFRRIELRNAVLYWTTDAFGPGGLDGVGPEP
jgi:hypothetical protein